MKYGRRDHRSHHHHEEKVVAHWLNRGRAQTGLACASLLIAAVTARGGECDPHTAIVSVASTGEHSQGSFGTKRGVYMTPDGRYVVFASHATNLVPDDTNGVMDVFVHDRLTGETERVSVSSAGGEGNADSGIIDRIGPSISNDGRYVAFQSQASNLVANDTNGASDSFVHDRQTGITTRVSVWTGNVQGNGGSFNVVIAGNAPVVAFDSGSTNWWFPHHGGTNVYLYDIPTGTTQFLSIGMNGQPPNHANGGHHGFMPSISDDGQYVAFMSGASNLVPGDTNNQYDVFVRDMAAQQTVRVSVSTLGEQSNGPSNSWCSISASGRFIAFASHSTNLVADDINGHSDVFVHDRLTGETTMESLSTDGEQSNRASVVPVITPDGRYVVFQSQNNNWIPGDNTSPDVFMRDRATGETRCISRAHDGGQPSASSWGPAAISHDGRFIAFQSSSDNLMPIPVEDGLQTYVRVVNPCPVCEPDIAPPGGDGSVGVPDLLLVINSWGACPTPPDPCIADIAPPGGDGSVGVPDLLMIINNWGACP